MQFARADSPLSDHRRITAESFRLLTARIKNKGQIPEIFAASEPETPLAAVTETQSVVEESSPVAPSAPAPPPIAAASLDLPSHFDLPAFVPLNEDLAPDVSAPEPSEYSLEAEYSEGEATDTLAAPAESGEVVFTVEAAQFDAYETSAEFADAEVPVVGEAAVSDDMWEPVAEVMEVQNEAATLSPDPIHEEVAADQVAMPETHSVPMQQSEVVEDVVVGQEPAGGDVAVEADAGNETAAEPQSLSEVIGGARLPRAASPLSERVVDALVKTVTDAIYAKPSASERAAFLREIAELVDKGEGPEPQTTPESLVATLEPEPEPQPQSIAAEVPPGSTQEPGSQKLGDALAGRLSATSSLLRKTRDDDPFAQSPLTAAVSADRKIEEMPEVDEDTGETAMSLLDMMSGGHATSQPQERALAADTLLRLVPRIPAKQLLAIAERVAIMEQPPSRLVAKLIRDSRHEIASPLLERCMHITDQDLATATAEGDAHKLRMIARRRVISPTLSDQLIDRGDTSVILTLVRNPGASLNHDSFFRLADHATEHHSVLAPLVTRADLPAPVAFELFWHVPQELRRFILSRFLTDSENLNRILKITLAAEGGGETPAEQKFPPQDVIESALGKAAAGQLEQASQQLADASGTHFDTVMRVLSDREGEPVAVLLKTIGFQRSKFADAVAALQNGEIALLRPDRKLEELQSIFDTLSFNKARILLTYWDWHARKAGPYAPQN